MSTSSPDVETFRTNLAREVLLYALVAALVGAAFWPLVAHPAQVICGDQSDMVGMHYPYRFQLAEALRTAGRPPLWNPTTYAGMPLVGDPISGIFYPPNWIYGLFRPGSAGHVLSWYVVAHVLVAGWGALFWLGGRGFGFWQRLAGAAALALAGKWFVHLVQAGHLDFQSLCWCPWQLGLVDRLARRPRLATSGLLAAVTALGLLSDHPQIVVFSHLIVAAYACGALAAEARGHRLRSAGAIALGLLLAAGLAAVHALPIFEIKDSFVRGNAMSYDLAAGVSLRPIDYAGLFLPGWSRPLHHFYWEAWSFVGLAALALACLAPWRAGDGWRIWPLVGVAVFCLWYALGRHGGLHWLLYEYVPGFSLFRIPPRILLVLGVPLAYLSAAGIDVIARAPRRAAQGIPLAVLAAVAVVLVVVEPSLESLLAVGIIAAVAVLWLLPRAQGGAAVAAALAILVVVDQLRVAAPLVRVKPWEELVVPVPQLTDELRAPLGRERILTYRPDSFYETPLPIVYAFDAHLEMVNGYNGFQPKDVYELIWQPGIRRAYDLLNVRWLVSTESTPPPNFRLRNSFDDVAYYAFDQRAGDRMVLDKVYVYENSERMPRAALVRSAQAVDGPDVARQQLTYFDPRRELLIEDSRFAGQFPGQFAEVPVEHTGQRIQAHLDAGQGGYLLLSEMWYPGWRALVNGRDAPLLRANSAFLAVPLGPGEHDVVLAYRPRSYDWGLRITAASLTLLGLLFLADFALRWRRPTPAR